VHRPDVEAERPRERADGTTSAVRPHSGFGTQPPPCFRVGVVGGGVAGSTVALRLAELETLEVILLEQGPSLVNGPPFCHLHAGGNLYRDISDHQCVTLLEQSVETLKSYPHVVRPRPTVVAVPAWNREDAAELLPRLGLLREAYADLIAKDPRNEVLGPATRYFMPYGLEQLQNLSRRPLPAAPGEPDEWMIPLARAVDLETLKAPLYLVQEYGLSPFRLAASSTLALDRLPFCNVMLETRVDAIHPTENGWLLQYGRENGQTGELEVDYLVNACGFRSGALDDMAGYPRARMVEFKASYVARWEGCGSWPEVIFHGQRGTPNGMAQLSPYADDVFQIHGMTEDITLFRECLVASTPESAQPQLGELFLNKVERGWDPDAIRQRTETAIAHVARFLPGFAIALPAGKPLFGAQQIPGTDPSLRVAGVSFGPHQYARTEIVKVSSALAAATAILERIMDDFPGAAPSAGARAGLVTPATIGPEEVLSLAYELAQERDYPAGLV